jgi:hypothetical protein
LTYWVEIELRNFRSIAKIGPRLWNKSSSFDTALGVTKFIADIARNLIALLKSDLGVQQTRANVIKLFS